MNYLTLTNYLNWITSYFSDSESNSDSDCRAIDKSGVFLIFTSIIVILLFT